MKQTLMIAILMLFCTSVQAGRDFGKCMEKVFVKHVKCSKGPKSQEKCDDKAIKRSNRCHKIKAIVVEPVGNEPALININPSTQNKS